MSEDHAPEPMSADAVDTARLILDNSPGTPPMTKIFLKTLSSHIAATKLFIQFLLTSSADSKATLYAILRRGLVEARN